MKERPDRLYECLYCGSVQTYDEVFFDKKKTRANMNSSATSTEEIYRWGVVARKDGRYKDAAEIFSQISDYRNASALRLECLSHLEAEKKENRYARACSMMQEGNIHFARQAAELFGSLSGFRDSARKREECLVFIRQQQEALEKRKAELQQANRERRRKRRVVVFSVMVAIVATITFFVLLQKTKHGVQDIRLSVIDVSSEQDDRYYYVYLDFKIENHSKTTVDYIEITTYFFDKNGKSVGTLTSSFGSRYGDVVLNLSPDETVIKETYLKEYKASDPDDFFVMLYNNGSDGLSLVYEITYVEWSDGHTYDRVR